MSNLLNAVKVKFNHLKQNVMLRTVLISGFALLLIFSITLAWYINNLGLWGMEFNTGNIDFNAYVYSEDGTRLIGPISPDDENRGDYINAPLFTIDNAQVGSTGTVYIAVESTGSLGIQYRLAFDITGRNESSTAYLGGYKYNISKVTDKVDFSASANMNVSRCPRPDKINDEIVTIDRNAVNGSIEDENGYDVYRFDYTLVHKNEEYTSNSLNFYLNIFATQIGGDFEDTEERGYTYYCSTKEDLDRAKVEAYPGDIIKLSSDIAYYGDLVFNKPINLETNDFTLTVNGNLMYDYVLGNSLTLDAGGLGRIVVQCTKEGVGGNLKIKAPLSNVTLKGANSSNGDIVVEKNITVDATNTFGASGISLNNIRIVDNTNLRKAISVESNTRVTVSFGTTIGLLQSVVKANNIEIVNNGVIGEINLSNMSLLEQTNSPQIYILNNNDINSPISLPSWSKKFVEDASGNCTGNTRIVQSYSGSPMNVTGNCDFTNKDIEVEKINALVEQIEQNNDSRLKIYYQDQDGQITSIQSILENYFQNVATTGCKLNEVLQLEIISIGDKAITNEDIAFMNGNSMLSLKHLDMERANIYDRNMGTYRRLADSAFMSVSKYETLVLPQNLEVIGAYALARTNIENIITVPAGVTVFGNDWFMDSNYVGFASSVPVAQATAGLTGVKAVFVEEAYIGSYKSVYSQYASRIYPVSVLDESKQHFVRNTKNDEWEITHFIRGEDAVIGKNITINGSILKITSVYDQAYRHNFNGSKVEVADTVENLGAGNFINNKNITYVDLNNIKTLGADVFSGCSALTQLVISESLETIGSNAFYGCTGLNQEVILPRTMRKIGANAFHGTKITGVHTGGTTSIDGRAFYNCTSLIYAEMPDVKLVGEDGTNELFAFCNSLVSVKMPSFVKAAGQEMFLQCTSLRELYMDTKDDGINFGNYAFQGIDVSRIKLYVPEEHLGFYQSKCPGGLIATMIYPKGEKMGEELVNGFNIGTYIVSDLGGDSYALITSNIDHSGDLVIPEAFNGRPITRIYANAFRNQGFTDVTLTIGNNITAIGSYAFYGRNGLSAVTLGNGLETIGSAAFSYCSNLSQDIVLPNSMKKIDSDAFSYSGITGVHTGGTVSVDDRAFKSCFALIYAQMPNVTVAAESGSNELFAWCQSLVSVDMPKLANVYGERMFEYCTSLSEIYMGSKNPNITLGNYAFMGANSNQIKLFVPEDLVSFYMGRAIVGGNMVYPMGEKLGDKSVNGFVIGDYILLRNDNGYTLVTSNLDYTGSVDVPNVYKDKPITEIYMNAFRNQNFTNARLRLGDNVTVIGDGAFHGRTGLEAVVMDQVTTIGAEAFYRSGIQVLNGPNLMSLGDNAFRSCRDLQSVNLPKLERIDKIFVFTECSNLKSVYLENVMSLHMDTFISSTKLEKITINKQINSDGSNMPSAFSIEPSAPCKIYVPYHSLSYYTNPWSGKPVVSFDAAGKYNGDTYILREDNEGKYAVIDYMPSKTVTSLTLPSTVTATDIGNITVYSIEYGAFATVAHNLKDITLPSTMAKLGNGALSECRALENIYVASNNMFFTSVSGVLYSKDQKMLVKYPVGRSGRFDMTGAGYEYTVGIGASAFENATELTEITFPASLLVIDSSAFENCTKLQTVEFTGTTPPTLMGSSIFDTGVDGFKMVIPTSDANVVTAYLCAYNFAEYEPYINLGGNAAPSSTTERNQVSIGSRTANNSVLAMLSPGKDEGNEDLEKSSDEDNTSGDGPNPPQNATEADGSDAEGATELPVEA